VQTRFRFVPLLAPLEFLLRVFLVERDVERLPDDLRHVLLGVLDTENFGQAFELVLEIAIGSEAKVLWRAIVYGESVLELRRRSFEREHFSGFGCGSCPHNS